MNRTKLLMKLNHIETLMDYDYSEAKIELSNLIKELIIEGLKK